ncbi:ABC transporter substrate-binding protein [Rhodopila sp.]|jgi:branched-chain amino acid transport system substrate-binding protein|uniref:ABC transporter substrate-binding protein n=1 Tax=Rhodopila sp. TaxID=2480087 RepID=UPI002BEFC8F7|nr:ABC transporter substrate-binding protein [Rhodopila sp.]HVZ09901.1 ABC transporter substrate-binding protein [Rhodopila sp.]
MKLGLLIATALALPVAAHAQPCELKIGAMGPMSGGAAQWGLAMLTAAQFAAAEVNQAGGVKIDGKPCKVTVVPYDSKYTADGAAAGSNALAAQDIHVIIGPVGSPEATGIKPVAARNGQIAWNAAYAKNALEPKYPLMFHIAPGPAAWADAMIKRVMKDFPMKSVALIAPNDQGGTDIATVDAEAYRANGLKTTEEYYQRGTTNFAPIVTRILAANPDVVDTASSPPGDAGVIVKQLRLAGFKGPIGRLGGPGTDEILRVSGGIDVLQNFYWFETVPTDDPKVKAIDDEYRKLMGKDPVGGTSFWADLPAARMTLKAIGIAGTDDAQKVAAALRTLPVEDPNIGKGYWGGKKQFGIAQELQFPFGVGIIKDGKNLGVERQDVKPE